MGSGRRRIVHRRRKVGGARRIIHRRRHVHRIPASLMTFGGATRHHYRKHRGGFLPAIPASVLAVHSVLQRLKPITNGEKLANDLGLTGVINSGLDKLGIFGKAFRGIGSFAKNTLGYGCRRHNKVGGRRHR